MIQLGSRYRDKISGYTGIATGFCQYLSGCNQALISPPVAADGALREAAWFDIQRLELIEANVVSLDNGATPGCDKPAPKR